MKMNELSEQMKRFWNEGTRKHPYFCVVSGLRHLRADIDAVALGEHRPGTSSRPTSGRLKGALPCP